MFYSEDLEDKIQKNEKKSKDLLLKLLDLDREEKKLLEELNVTPEQLTAFISVKENFTDHNWQTLGEQKTKLDQKLQTDLSNIRNPKKAQKAFAERKVDNHWLFVR